MPSCASAVAHSTLSPAKSRPTLPPLCPSKDFTNSECYQAVSYSLRDRLIELWNDTQTYFK